MNQDTLIKNSFDNVQTTLLSELMTSLNNEQKIWLSGYLSGINESTGAILNLLSRDNGFVFNKGIKTDISDIKILFGTRSGNSQKVANIANKKALSLGLRTSLINLNEYDSKNIKNEKNILIIVSTDGEGEPTVSTEEFYNYIFKKNAPKLKNLSYSVLALGDSSYQHFCKIGKDIDNRLYELGAKRILERIDCDMDFEKSSDKWIDNSLRILAKEKNAISVDTDTEEINKNIDSELKYSKEKPFIAPILEKVLLNGKGSSKETIHYELSIENSGIKYHAGDSLGVYSSNNTELVDKVLQITKLNENDKIFVGNNQKTIRQALTYNFELTRLTPALIKSYAELAQSKKLDKLISDNTQLEKFVWGRDIIDLLEEFPVSFNGDSLFSTLIKLQPRLYSISSSYNANPDEVHITVTSVKYNRNNREHKGVCSTFLADIIDDNSAQIPIYIVENIGFRLPKDSSTPIIMVGAGTGIAPYRAFLQERSLSSNSGKTWLFFGERNFSTDFLYQSEWQKLKKNKTLTNIDLAFSRDQKNKIYIQHKLLQQKKEVYKWIQDGAHIYVCGNKGTLAKGVKHALISIIESEGGFNTKNAEEFFTKLKRENRFLEDVY